MVINFKFNKIMKNSTKVYKIFENKNDAKPYYVAVKVTDFWQQCSKNYFYKGCAQRALNKIIEKDKKLNIN